MVTESFSTAIYFADLQSRHEKRFQRELKEQCYLVRETDPEGREWSKENYVSGYTSYGSITDLHLRYPHFSELNLLVLRHVQRFARKLEFDLQGGTLQMSSCWVNIMSPGSRHSSHLHPLSVLSGTYYVSVPRGASAITFEDPRLGLMMAAPPKLATSRQQLFRRFQPETGQVGLWESWLRHEVPTQTAKADRISVSFNFDWVPAQR